MNSQLAYVILREGVTGKANSVQSGSNRWRNVVKLVMAAEEHALIFCYYYPLMIWEFFSEMLDAHRTLRHTLIAKAFST